MGCGGSRLDSEGKQRQHANNLPPTVRRRFTNVRRRRKHSYSYDNDKDDAQSNCHSRSQSDESMFSAYSSAEESVATAKQTLECDDPLSVLEEEDEGRLSDFHEGYNIGPGSPSFKVYCSQQLEQQPFDDAHEEDDGDEDEDYHDTGLRSVIGDSDSGEIDSTMSNDGSVEKKMEKKGNRFSKMRVVLNKRKLCNKKDLFKVKFHYPSCSGRDMHRVVADKPETRV